MTEKKFILAADTYSICILDYPRMLHYSLKREPSWRVLYQKLHQFTDCS